VRVRIRKGLSLVETVIAMAILLAGFLLFTRLFVYGVRGMDRGADLVGAVSVAKSELARLKDDGKNNRWSTLLSENGRTYRVDGYEVELEVFERPCLSPSTDWDRPFIATPESRILASATAQVVVRVRGHGAETTLASLIGRPRLSGPSIEIRNVPASIPGSSSAVITAHLLVAGTVDEVPATFTWIVLPGSGNATITPSRNGREASILNGVSTPFGTQVVVSGQCRVQARALYFGEEILSQPFTVNLGS
jgi:hypothetical protein